MSATPNYASVPIVGAALLVTGDGSITAPSAANALAIFSPGVNGGMVERINVAPVATTTLSVIRIFRYDGTTMHFLFEFQLPAQSIVTGSVVIQDIVLSAVNYPDRFPIMVPAGSPAWTLRACLDASQTGVKVQAEGGGF